MPPPVHAWAAFLIYDSEKQSSGRGDINFLKEVFHKLLLNFTWWTNRRDRTGRNVFEGGFLGVDHISVFDRRAALPTGGFIEQAEGTVWMAFYCQTMLTIALELAGRDAAYEGLALKFADHFFRIGVAMDRPGLYPEGLWSEKDGFFYDLVRSANGQASRLEVRSLVGLLSLCATCVIPEEASSILPRLVQRGEKFFKKYPELTTTIASPGKPGQCNRHLLAILDETKLRRVLAKVLDENEFLSPYGLRSISRDHAHHPYVFTASGREYRIDYQPAEADTGLFGGNSNWRGPIWFPTNFLLIWALMSFHSYYGDDFMVECPTGSGKMMTLGRVALEISHRLVSIFKRNVHGRRPVYGGSTKFQTDPLWRDHILFYEYFHGDNGAGLGAGHKTGWTGLVAGIIHWIGRSSGVPAERPE
ncbi:MAG: hypothetical protein HQK59_07735 [Deltaproteobacteria bacterium]|nr:hypothetical protein [Deltaproteobacteria bacterium]